METFLRIRLRVAAGVIEGREAAEFKRQNSALPDARASRCKTRSQNIHVLQYHLRQRADEKKATKPATGALWGFLFRYCPYPKLGRYTGS